MYNKNVKLKNDYIKYLLRKYKKRRSRVTVCIAVINNGMIFGAADRMVTAGDIEFESASPKILELTSAIVVLTAGDQNIQMQVYQKAFQVIMRKIAPNPEIWIDVRYAAEIYSQCFYELRNKMIEDSVLSMYGLSFDSYITRQKQMSGKTIEEINERIIEQAYSWGGIKTIITGVDTSAPHVTQDSTSPHIFVVKDGEIFCHDKLGFVAVGGGSNHAESHLMLSNFATTMLSSSALLAVHQAKRKAEICPGVGKKTDLFLIGGLGKFQFINRMFNKDIIKKLDEFYEEYTDSIEELRIGMDNQIESYLDKISKLPKSEQESGSPSLSPSSEPKESKKNDNKKKI